MDSDIFPIFGICVDIAISVTCEMVSYAFARSYRLAYVYVFILLLFVCWRIAEYLDYIASRNIIVFVSHSTRLVSPFFQEFISLDEFS